MAEEQQGKAKAFGLGPDRKALHARARPNAAEAAAILAAVPQMRAKTRERLSEIESWFAALYTEGQVRYRLRKEHGLTISQANRLIRRARRRWQDESSSKERAQRVAELDATVRAGIRAALARQGLVLDRDGGEHWYPNPDVGALVRGAEMLARLHGDMNQPAVLPGEAFGDTAMAALQGFFYGKRMAEAEQAERERETVVAEVVPEKALGEGRGDR